MDEQSQALAQYVASASGRTTAGLRHRRAGAGCDCSQQSQAGATHAGAGGGGGGVRAAQADVCRMLAMCLPGTVHPSVMDRLRRECAPL